MENLEKGVKKVISKAEEKFGRTVNYILYAPEEFAEKSKEKGGFLAEVLKDKKIMLVGSEGELKELESQ